MTGIQLVNLIKERYYTIGKNYFKESFPNEKLPKLVIYSNYYDDGHDIYTIQGAMLSVTTTDSISISTGQYVDRIIIYLDSILFGIVCLTHNINLPYTFYKVYVDRLILHELSHAIICLYNRDMYKYKNLPLRVAMNKWKDDQKLRNEEKLVDEMANDRMQTFNESTFYHDLAEINHWIHYIDREASELNDNITDEVIEKREILDRDHRTMVDKLERVCNQHLSSYRGMVLHELNRKFMDSPEKFKILKDGTYVNKETKNIVLKPNI